MGSTLHREFREGRMHAEGGSTTLNLQRVTPSESHSFREYATVVPRWVAEASTARYIEADCDDAPGTTAMSLSIEDTMTQEHGDYRSQ